MSDPDLTPATREDVALTLMIALSLAGRKSRIPGSRELMARIVAERLVEHLERSGFVIMKRPPAEGGAAIDAGIGSELLAKVRPGFFVAAYRIARTEG